MRVMCVSGSNSVRIRSCRKRRGDVLCVIALLLALAGCSQQLMPTPNAYVHSNNDPFGAVAPGLRSNQVDILIATDRAPVADAAGKVSYGFGRSRSLMFGSCVVEIGKGVSWADLVAESRKQSRSISLPMRVADIREIGRFPETPYDLVEVNRQVKEDPAAKSELAQADAKLCEELSRRMALNPGRKDVFIYVHGVSNTLDESAFVMAELWHFMGRPGVAVVYAWPAGKNYAYDRESGEFSVFHLKQFLRSVSMCPAVEKIHIVAHSRGTDVTMTAIRELNIRFKALDKDTRKELKLGNVVLAAADLDTEVFGQRLGAERVQLVPERLTFYISQSDKALGAAEWLFDSIRRLGQISAEDIEPSQKKSLALLPEVQFIDARVKTDYLGHSYFHTNPAVSSDLILLLRDDYSAGAENGRPLIHQEGNFWEIRDDYMLQSTR